MSIKKKIGGAVLATALGAALISGGSYALFTDTAENTGNTFTTGGVTIEDIGSTLKSTHFFDDLAPGDAESWTVTIENKNNLDAWVKVVDGAEAYDMTGDLFKGEHGLEISENTQVVKIPAGQSRTFDFSYNFPKEAGNVYQGAKGELTINFQAVQVRNNDGDSGPTSWE
ncbi:Camelysin metallo-endopeptidase [Bacillus sp. THAF10]|uniref:TasA family protein n=1 Tax=Bacillus sp. THAF10 TaxID=2587848 RepID=UPI001268D6CF|nr:TasA family protein [Bacillus sp. THAF10]QFT90559.1 Camelysin metallo-endopeptidase [Bacillus sp. THAF10]